MMKLFITILITFMVFLSCPNPSNNDPDVGSLQNMNQNGITTLYSSSFTINSTSIYRSVIPSDTIIKTLSYINENNNIVPITFATSNGKEVVLNIDNVMQIGSKRIIIRYSAIYEISNDDDNITYISMQKSKGQILIDIETSSIYDFSEFSSIEFPHNYLVIGDTLYVNKLGYGSTLYKINLNNISIAIPLNNSNYFGSGDLYFKLGDKIITSVGSFDINQEFPPRQFLSFTLSDLESSLAKGSQGENWPITLSINGPGGTIPMERYFIVDSNGDIWIYCFFRFLERSFVGQPSNKYFIIRLTIDNNGQLGYTDYSEGTIPFNYDHSSASNIGIFKFYNSGIMLHLVGNMVNSRDGAGRILIKTDSNNAGINITIIDKTVYSWDIDKYYNFTSGGFDMSAYYFRVNGSNIEKVMLFTDDLPVVVYTITDPDVQNIWLTDDRIYYWKWLNALTGATYFIPLDNLSAEPELVTQSSAVEIEIIEIFQFNF